MPIVAAASTDSASAYVALVAATAVSLLLAAGGAFRPRWVNGPDRADPFSSVWRLLLVVASGFFVWLLVQVEYGTYLQARQSRAAAHPQQISAAQLSPRQWAFLATVPPMAALVTLLGGDWLAGGPAALRGLGIAGKRLFLRGAAAGLLGTVVVLPLLAWVLTLIDAFYRRVHYEHPEEHELLKVMRETGGGGPVRAALIAGAVVVAPLFEELLFRGHVQTAVRSMLIRAGPALVRVAQRVAAFGAADVRPTTECAAAAKVPPAPAPLEYEAVVPVVPYVPRVWQTWAAIVIASLFFAAVHPVWMWPPIFFLSLCLGYAYERTGSLWTPVVIHALFNATSTWIYLHSH